MDNTIQTLEPYVQHDNEDIQFAAISSLRMHTSSKKTQEIFEKLLNITNQEQVRHSIFMHICLCIDFDVHAVQFFYKLHKYI